VPYGLAEYDALHGLELDTHASAEAQVAAIADDIAYNNHDLADGLRAANGESVRIDVRDGLKPGVVRGESDEFTYLVMPVRLPAAVS